MLLMYVFEKNYIGNLMVAFLLAFLLAYFTHYHSWKNLNKVTSPQVFSYIYFIPYYSWKKFNNVFFF